MAGSQRCATSILPHSIPSVNDNNNSLDEKGGMTSHAETNVHAYPIVVDQYKELIQHLQLDKYYPEKISLADVMTAGDDVPEGQPPMKNVIWDILKRLIMNDHRAISSDIHRFTDSKEGSEEKSTSACTGGFADIDDLIEDSKEFNPLDVFLTIFSCCNLRLRQILTQKMYLSRLAVPFLTPGLDNGYHIYNQWALRTTILMWRDKTMKTHEGSAVNCSLDIVSSIRLKRPNFSKSKLLNNVISDLSHPTFLNVDSPNGKIEKVVSDGLVEAAFFLPSCSKADTLVNATMFLNLRGDGIKHEKQVDVLSAISNAIIICLDITDLNDPDIIKSMRIIHGEAQKVVFVFSNQQNIPNQTIKEQLNMYTDNIGVEHTVHISKVFAFTGQKNASHLKTETRKLIHNSIKECSGKSLTSTSQIMLNKGIHIDENINQSCQQAKSLADEMMKLLNGSNNTKSELLPLQGKYWKEWCDDLKKKKRFHSVKGQQNVIQHIGEIEKNMSKHRQNQNEISKQLGKFVTMFVDDLKQTIDTPVVDYFIQWLKMYLDDMSREQLPGLQHKYDQELNSYKAKKQSGQHTENMLRNIRAIEQEIEDAAFGMEHLMREIGQIYEASMSSKDPEQQLRFKSFPAIVTKLLLKGHALEILDGDASGVPQQWLEEVFTQLEALLGKKRIFCLSILGIQSSGKSTLLNTMFGLEFPVSAGRCTRGVYLQLVKVTNGSKLPFDYIAIIDSEGLRAPELGESKVDHDNELATFVIGLGSVTLLNIKGENVADIQDILQVVSHAFLRMNMVNKIIQKERSCVFIHQNVSAVNAFERMQSGAQKLEEALDKKTMEAAALENISDIHSFNQIIKFDNKLNVWHFPDLWHGNPPMASVNIDYHEKVRELKDNILTNLAKQSMSCSDLMVMIRDMWHGVLADDFVFGFRNGLVTNAYNKLEHKFAELKWDLQKCVLDWLDKIQWTEYANKPYTDRAKLQNEAVSILRQTETRVVAQLTAFIEDSPEKTIMYDWIKEKCYGLTSAANIYCTDVKKTIDRQIILAEVSILKDKNQDQHRQEIIIKAEELAQEMRGHIEDKAILEDQFERMWAESICKINYKDSEEEKPTADIFRRLLFESVPSNAELIRKAIEKNPINVPPTHMQLRGSFKMAELDGQLSFKKCSFLSLGPSQKDKEALQQKALHMLDEIFEDIDAQLLKMQGKKSKFLMHDAEEVILKVQSKLKDINQHEEAKFTIPTDCQAKILVHVIRYALNIFKKMQAEYDRTWSARAQLEAYKQVTMNHFMNSVTEKANELIIVDMICGQMDDLIIKQVNRSAQLSVVKEIVPHFLTKSKLIKAILRDLAEKESFQQCKAYISSPKNFAFRWLKKYTDDYIFEKEKSSSWVERKCQEHVREIIIGLRQAIAKACDSVTSEDSTAKWIQTFINKVSPIIAITQLQHLEKYSISDYSDLNRRFVKHVTVVEERVNELYKQKTVDTFTWADPTPYEQIQDALWGCEALCPFCSEPCKNSNPKHASATDCHMCIQHRPQGVSAISWWKSSKLCCENCSYHVQSDNLFRCHEAKCVPWHTECNWHPFKEYKKRHPTWHIERSSDMDASKYWMWYLNRFQHDIIKGTNHRLPDIPASWVDITKKEAIDSLSVYN